MVETATVPTSLLKQVDPVHAATFRDTNDINRRR